MAKNKKGYLQEYLESEEFDYDYKQDPVYQAMKKQYLSEAERTAEDVLGKYSQISGGGTPSSAAISAASMGAGQIKSKLAEALPELYDLAWDMYEGELEDRRKKYEAVLGYDKFIDDSYDRDHEGYYRIEEEPTEGDKESDDTESGGSKNPEGGKKPSYEASQAGGNMMEKSMESGAFEMTLKMIERYISMGDIARAKSLYAGIENSISRAQRGAINRLLEGK